MAKSIKTLTFKEAGRPAGSPNKGTGYVRNISMSFRATEGLQKTIEALIASGNYKTKSDVIHEAVQILGFKKLSKKMEIYWLNKIQ